MNDEERAIELARLLTGRAGLSKEKHIDPILELIQKVREECADKADKCLERQGFKTGLHSLRMFMRIAITGRKE